MKILLLEDDELFNETITEFLTDNGHEITSAFNVDEAVDVTFEMIFDLYLFDINLPDGSGVKLLKSLRESGDITPAIFLTSYTDKKTLSQGFDAGCNDYIKKPADLDELLLRVNVYNSNNYEALGNNITFDTKELRLYRDGKDLNFSPKSLVLLSLLLSNKGKIVTNELIEDTLYHMQEPSRGAIRVFINTLKQLLGKDSIVNIRGVGYKLQKTS
jgi:DNA-binding response OmpR family regulator